MEPNNISTIDLQKLPYELDPNQIIDEIWKDVAIEMRKGFAELGVVCLINHGVPQITFDEMFNASKDFFRLSEKAKMHYEMDKSNFTETFDNYFGYWHPEISSTGLKDHKEMFECLENLGKYPDDTVPHFSITKDILMKELKRVSKKILLLLGIALELDDPWYFVKKSTHIDMNDSPRAACLRMLHYHPIRESGDELHESINRSEEHTDTGLFTLLSQDNVGGLEVKTLDGKWLDVTPVPDSIIMQIGDLLEFWSGGLFHAVKHRVTSKLNTMQISRYSIAYFFMPDVETEISPLQIKKKDCETANFIKKGFEKKYGNKHKIQSMEYVLGGLGRKYG